MQLHPTTCMIFPLHAHKIPAISPIISRFLLVYTRILHLLYVVNMFFLYWINCPQSIT